MPSERSLYHKIEIILDLAKSAKVSTVADLRDAIYAQRPPTFFSKRFDRRSDTFIDEISGKVIRRSVNLCIALRLLETDGTLTTEGREALRKTRFDRVVA